MRFGFGSVRIITVAGHRSIFLLCFLPPSCYLLLERHNKETMVVRCVGKERKRRKDAQKLLRRRGKEKG